MYELTASGVRDVTSQAGQPAQLPQGAGTTRTPEAEAGAITAAQEEARSQADIRQSSPESMQSLNDAIADSERILSDFEAGKIQTGFFQGRAPVQFMGPEDEEFQVFVGQRIIDAISSATFGQLSEGEREFLRTTVPNRTFTEEANKRIIRRRLEILRKAKAIEEGRYEAAGGQTTPQPTNDPLGIR